MGEELDRKHVSEAEGSEGEVDRTRANDEPEVEAHMKRLPEPTEKQK